MHAVAATGARRALMLAVALSCLVSAEAYLRTEKGKTYECDMKEVNAFTAGENPVSYTHLTLPTIYSV